MAASVRAEDPALRLSALVRLVAMLAFTTAFAGAAPQERPSTSRTALAGALPPLDGSRLRATLVEVTYPPGGANPAHHHPCPVIGYVLEGAVRMQIKGQPERIYNAGEAFSETPSDLHLVSANASQDVQARFLAYFVCDRETRLSIPVGAGHRP